MFRPSDEQDPIGMLQREVFRPLSVNDGSRKTEMPAIEAYFNQLGRNAAKGSVTACRELVHLTRFFDPQIRQGDGVVETESGKKIRWLVEECKKNYDKVVYFRGIAHFVMRWAFREAYEKQRGPLEDFFDHIPDHCDLQTLYDDLPRLLRAANRRKPKSDYEIGYKKPHPDTKWKAGQSGRPKRSAESSTTADPRRAVFTAFVNALTQSVTLSSDGKPSRRPSLEIACRQILKKGMGTDKEACRQVRNIVEILHSHGRLVPPPSLPARKRVRKGTPEEVCNSTALMKTLIWAMVPDVKAEMVKIYADKYGPLVKMPTKFMIKPPTKKSIMESSISQETKLSLLGVLENSKKREREMQSCTPETSESFEDVDVLGPNFDGEHDVSFSDEADPHEGELLSTPRESFGLSRKEESRAR